MQIDLKVSQLLCSRLCHDLIGSASAINAGLELIHDDPADTEGPLDLMDQSATQLSTRLAFFRCAFGLAEGARGPAEVAEIRSLAADYFEGGKIKLNWPESASFTDQKILPGMSGKIILNLTLMANGCLPRGGDVLVHVVQIPEGIGIAIEAKGPGVRLAEDIKDALTQDAGLDQLNAHNVHAYYAQCMARDAGGAIETQEEAGGESVQFAILFPAT